LRADIEEVHRRGALVHENWSSLKFWNSVTIRRRSALLRNFMISPDDPDRFAARLQEAARRSVGAVTLSGLTTLYRPRRPAPPRRVDPAGRDRRGRARGPA